MRAQAAAARLTTATATNEDNSATPLAALSKRDVLPAFAGLVVAKLLSSLYQTVFSTALPTIVGSLDGVDQMLWITTAYMLATTIAMPVYGKMSDLMGRKLLFISALGLFLLGSVIGGLATDMTMLIAGRAVQGLGGGGLLILPYAIIADIVPPRQRGRYMGFLSAVFGFSSVLGPVVGGWFTDDIGWRWAFWLNLPLGFLAIVCAVLFLKPGRRKVARPRVDIAGISFVGVTVTSIVLAATWGGTHYAWTSPVMLGLIGAALVAGIAFIFVERRAAEPLIPLHLFRDRNFNLATLGSLALSVAMFGTVSYMPTYLQMVNGVDATGSGFLMLPVIGGLVATSILGGNLATHTGRYKWMPVAGVSIVALGLFLLSTLQVDTALWQIVVYQLVLGGGIGLGVPILVLIVQNSFPLREVGTATASSNFFREIGASLGAGVVGALFTSRVLDLLTVKAAAYGEAAMALDKESLTPSLVLGLAPSVRAVVVESYNEALTPVFLYLVPLMLAGAVLLAFVREKPLALSNEEQGADQSACGAGVAAQAGIAGRAEVAAQAGVAGRAGASRRMNTPTY